MSLGASRPLPSTLILLAFVTSCSSLGGAGRGLRAVGLASLRIQGDSPVGGVKWSPNFTTSQLHYNVTMPKWTKEVTVTPVSSSAPPGKITVQTIVRPIAVCHSLGETSFSAMHLPPSDSWCISPALHSPS